ncbi:hypothetical protein CHLRE_02g115700v5 [Chlamydomonas reinhardtii]|uniref:Uncharacterized protein n=1 Tax=Chlamydomonas reinhardtii TaxID=3055 RepID=A0A2K3E3E5_CHLRE|nr:uncharacterized protein CHLRE_02g115700v5 [Chlamydomonas reinhardtii]PNW87267.1 hypothetical protein CHLRE_02g115700v5 [Chlamydomonas reinhardtii]
MAKAQQVVSPFEKAMMVIVGIITGIVVGYCVMETAEAVFAASDTTFINQPGHVGGNI